MFTAKQNPNPQCYSPLQGMTAGDGGGVAATSTVALGKALWSPLSKPTPQAQDHLPGLLPAVVLPLLLLAATAGVDAMA
jgi:hypothetical protein